jgi:hypothetical protein
MFKNGLKISFMDVIKSLLSWIGNKLSSLVIIIISLILIGSLVMNYIYYKKGLLITYDKRTFIITTTFQGQSQSTNIYGKEVITGKNIWTKVIIKKEEFQGLLNSISMYQSDKLKYIENNGNLEVFMPTVEMKQTNKKEEILE